MSRSPTDIETHYRQSAFIEEICVLDRHAVVVPNMALIRKKQIVNVGDILRFEIEGLRGRPAARTSTLLGYDVWFEPLPRTTHGRDQAAGGRADRPRARGVRRDAPLAAGTRRGSADPHAAAAAAVMQPRLRGRRAHRARAPTSRSTWAWIRWTGSSSLAELEQRFGVRVAATAASEIFTVRQLVEAVRPRDRPSAFAPAYGGQERFVPTRS